MDPLSWTSTCEGCGRDEVETAMSTEHGARVLCAECSAPAHPPSADPLAGPPARLRPQPPPAAKEPGERKLRRLDIPRMLREEPPPVPWVITGVAARGHLTMLAGREKTGKSLLVAGFAVAVAHGGGAVAGITCHPGRVLILDAENGTTEVHRRVRMLGLDTDSAESFEVYSSLGFDLGRDLSELASLIALHEPDMVVLDSYRSLWGGDENDTAAVARALDPLRRLAHERSVAAVLIHHANRGSGLYRGSSAIGSSVENILLLERRPDDPDRRRRRLGNNGGCRFARDADDRWLRIDADERLGALFIDEAAPLEGESSPRPAPIVEQLTTEIAANMNGTAMSLADVARAVGRDPKDGSVRNALAALLRDGAVSKDDTGRWTRVQGATPPKGPLHLCTPPETGVFAGKTGVQAGGASEEALAPLDGEPDGTVGPAPWEPGGPDWKPYRP